MSIKFKGDICDRPLPSFTTSY